MENNIFREKFENSVKVFFEIEKELDISNIKKKILLEDKNFENLNLILSKNEEKTIKKILKNEYFIELSKTLILYIIFFDFGINKKERKRITAELKKSIERNYKNLMWKIVLGNHDNFLILITLTCSIFDYLLKNEFFIKNNEEKFLLFCFDVLHFLIIGCKIGKKTIKDILIKKIKLDLTIEKNPSINSEKVFSQNDSISYIKLMLKKKEENNLKNLIQNRINYEKTINRVRQKMTNHKIKSNKILFIKIINFEKKKKKEFEKELKNKTKFKMDLNSFSRAFRNTSLEPPKKKEIRNLTRSFRDFGKKKK